MLLLGSLIAEDSPWQVDDLAHGRMWTGEGTKGSSMLRQAAMTGEQVARIELRAAGSGPGQAGMRLDLSNRAAPGDRYLLTFTAAAPVGKGAMLVALAADGAESSPWLAAAVQLTGLRKEQRVVIDLPADAKIPADVGLVFLMGQDRQTIEIGQPTLRRLRANSPVPPLSRTMQVPGPGLLAGSSAKPAGAPSGSPATPGGSGSGSAGAGLIASETFPKIGPLEGENEGIGWAGPWTGKGGQVMAGRLLPDASDGFMRIDTANSQLVQRNFAQPLTSGTYWLAFVLRPENKPNAWLTVGFPASDGNRYFVMGGHVPQVGTWWATRQEALGKVLNSARISSIPDPTARMVLRIDLQPTRSAFTLWVNPPAGNDPGLDRMADVTNAPPFEMIGIALCGSDGVLSIDDIRLGRSYADVR